MKPQVYKDPRPAEDFDHFHERARNRGPDWVYELGRVLLMPYVMLAYRAHCAGSEKVPERGPAIIAANHFSILDHFFVAIYLRRKVHFMAKSQLFKGLLSFFLSHLGVFPVRRGQQDEEAFKTAHAILGRGGIVMMYPEGGRSRTGKPGRPRPGTGRLALESGVPVIPTAIVGSQKARNWKRLQFSKVKVHYGDPLWLKPVEAPTREQAQAASETIFEEIKRLHYRSQRGADKRVRAPIGLPPKVRAEAGRVLTFARTKRPVPRLAREVTSRIWADVSLRRERLDRLPPVRTAAVIGAGSWGTAVAVLMARGGLEVELGCRTHEQAKEVAASGRNERYLPGVGLPEGLSAKRATEIELAAVDLLCLAVPSRSLPDVLSMVADRVGPRSAVLVLSKGLVTPVGTPPSEYVANGLRAEAIACLGGPAHALEAVSGGAALVLGCRNRGLGDQLGAVFGAAGLVCERTDDVIGVELAGVAKNAAALAAAAARSIGFNAAGAAAAQIWCECVDYALAKGAKIETFSGLAGIGDLTATVLSPGSRNRRAGELLAKGEGAEQIHSVLGQAAEGLDSVPLMAAAADAVGIEAPAVSALAAVIEGRLDAAEWASTLQRRSLTHKHALVLSDGQAGQASGRRGSSSL